MKRIILPVLLALIFAGTAPLSAQTLYWNLNTRTEVLKGDSKGVAIDDTGGISLAPKIYASFETNEQFIWSSAADASGNVYLGTGGNGRIFRVDSSGKGSLLFDSEELNVTALASSADGTLYAATSPDGKVYKIDKSGEASVHFEPKTKYIWSLAVTQDGALFVGTGETGRIFRVSKAGEDPDKALFYDSRETHIISLTTDRAGNVYAGTDDTGLVLRIGADKKAFALLDSPLREIHEISIGHDGSVYVLALSESVSANTPESPDANSGDDKTVTVDRPDPAAPPSPPTPEKSRYDLSSSKSVVYRILPDGTEDVIWNSEAIAAFAISADPNGGGVFVGTSDKGRIFRISDAARESLLIQTEDEQISTILVSGKEMVATTSNKGRSFKFGSATVDEGIYESPVLDAKSTAMWGRLWSEKTGTMIFETRSGNSARPGETWSAWSAAGATDGKISSPTARYFQWRARLNSAGQGLIRETSVSFAALNIAPEVLSIEVLGPNVGLAANPEVPVDPNIETLGLNPGDFGLAVAVVPPRRVFQTGARGVQWQASDRNGDTLRYTVYLKKIGEAAFRRIGSPSNSDFITLDGLTLEDGRYVVKVVADDSPSNGVSSAKSGERISEPFEIDNSPPVVTLVNEGSRKGSMFTVGFSATERSSFIKRAEYSVNGGKWFPVYPDDGIADGKTETFTVTADVGEDAGFVLSLRVFDSVGQIGSMRVVR